MVTKCISLPNTREIQILMEEISPDLLICRNLFVYLVRAEAYYWLNDDENSQKDLSSVMRKRISGFGSLGVSGDDLLKEIKNERARELYLEGFRLSDLKRWHDPIKRQKQLYSLQGPYNNEMEVKYTDAKYRFTTWPIPKHEIEATNGLVVGNASNN